MTLHTIHSIVPLGIDAHPVLVEVDVSPGLPSFTIVGQGDTQSRERRDRIRSAFFNSGLPWPQRRITVNVALDVRLGSNWIGLDLPIALGIAGAAGLAPVGQSIGAFGELNLAGSVVSAPGQRLAECNGYWIGPSGSQACATALSLTEAVTVANVGLVAEPQPQPRERLQEGELTSTNVVLAIGSRDQVLEEALALADEIPVDRWAARVAVAKASDSGEIGGRVDFAPGSATTVSVLGGGTTYMRPGLMSRDVAGVLVLDLIEAAPATVDAVARPAAHGLGYLEVARAAATVLLPTPAHLVLWYDPERDSSRNRMRIPRFRSAHVIDRRAEIPDNDPIRAHLHAWNHLTEQA